MNAGAVLMLEAPAGGWTCHRCGADLDGACEALTGSCGGVGPELVIDRLERAGATLLAMRDPAPGPGSVRSAMPEVLHDAMLAYGWQVEAYRAAIPGAAAISAMDRTFAWLGLIPRDRFVLRRIVAARSLVHPVTGRHILAWRRLARLVRADHHAVRRWHCQGIDAIVAALQRS